MNEDKTVHQKYRYLKVANLIGKDVLKVCGLYNWVWSWEFLATKGYPLAIIQYFT